MIFNLNSFIIVILPFVSVAIIILYEAGLFDSLLKKVKKTDNEEKLNYLKPEKGKQWFYQLKNGSLREIYCRKISNEKLMIIEKETNNSIETDYESNFVFPPGNKIVIKKINNPDSVLNNVIESKDIMNKNLSEDMKRLSSGLHAMNLRLSEQQYSSAKGRFPKDRYVQTNQNQQQNDDNQQE